VGFLADKVALKQVCLIIIEGPRSRCYGRTAALRLIVQPCDEDDEEFSAFPF
jgi:hypothetical protein